MFQRIQFLIRKRWFFENPHHLILKLQAWYDQVIQTRTKRKWPSTLRIAHETRRCKLLGCHWSVPVLSWRNCLIFRLPTTRYRIRRLFARQACRGRCPAREKAGERRLVLCRGWDVYRVQISNLRGFFIAIAHRWLCLKLAIFLSIWNIGLQELKIQKDLDYC